MFGVLRNLSKSFKKPSLEKAPRVLKALSFGVAVVLLATPLASSQQFERQIEIEKKKSDQRSSPKKSEKKSPTTEKLNEWGFSNATNENSVEPHDSRNWFWVGVGGLSFHPLQVSGAPSGSASFLGRFYETIHANMDLRLSDSLSLVPKVFFSPIGRGFADGGGRSRLFSAYAMVQYNWEKFRAGGGVGIFFQWLNGSGGSVTIQDGTGSETGYLPNRSVWTSQIPIILNFTYFLKERFDLFGEFVVTDAFSSKFGINFHMGVSYGLL